ncbi:MAG: deoxyribodipyrimidine photo-lyase [Dehalococcoidia bacterium]|nr:MAG: deoxyribodipyrimidine photo-lyase [Dehalococcoidia bacterium]
MIQESRMENLNQAPAVRGNYVLYWMQASQRAEYNHALEYAISNANESNLPVVAYFGITDNFPDANERHYRFMLEGLKETKHTLHDRDIRMVIRHESPDSGVLLLAKDAALVVTDMGYLNIQKRWRKHVASHINRQFIQIESDAIVPVRIAAEKEQYSAATIRPKIYARLPSFLVPLHEQNPKKGSLHMDFDSFDIEDIDKSLVSLQIDSTVAPVKTLKGGTSEARKHLHDFIEAKLERYAELRNDPNADHISHMSPYLHFGQISPIYIALNIRETDSIGTKPYLEELIIRRELSINFVFYNDNYDSIHGLPNWAISTLTDHRNDPREHLYSLNEFENAGTHDPYWNAAQQEMVLIGKMHGYMRMYWGKKILEWSKTPEEAFRIALYLNNKYELDGRDPNGFAGVSWCFGKHDRPWVERPVFGKIRYMNSAGLKRKFDAEAYVRKFTT